MVAIFQLVALAAALVLLGCRIGSAHRHSFLSHPIFRGVARRAAAATAAVTATAFVNAVLLSLYDPPLPAVHDEFSYLLAADTFSHGRMTNPTHRFWKHFETFHIIHEPTYQSKYPPAQGLALAIGQILTGRPLVGLWISVACACGSICWMLQAWLPARWALLGGLLAAFHPNIIPWWGGTYWGGAVAMFGGALLYGGLRRVMKTAHWRDAVLLAIGTAILATSRPYEGLVVSIPAAIVLLIWAYRNRKAQPAEVAHGFLIPTAATIAVAGALLGVYQYEVTGNALQIPYRVYQNTYWGHSEFIWTKPPPGTRLVAHAPSFANAREEHSTITAVPSASSTTSPATAPACIRILSILGNIGRKLLTQWYFYLNLALTIPLLALPALLSDTWTRLAVIAGCLVLAAVLLTEVANSHYTAPAACLVFFIVTAGLRWIYLRMHNRRAARVLALAVVVTSCMSLPLAAVEKRILTRRADWFVARAQLQARLEAQGTRRHLVIVRYASGHDRNAEWVHNLADIDAAPVVWARELDPDSNALLMQYFRDRAVWLLQADLRPLRLTRIADPHNSIPHDTPPVADAVPSPNGGLTQKESVPSPNVTSSHR